jgi:N-acetylglucosamine-6-phosphate deacetylase
VTYALCGATVFDGDQFLKDHCVIVKDKEIIEVVSSADLPANLKKITLADGILAPGFIDLQVNGGGGVMLNNARGKEGVDTMTAAHRHTGTTSMLPTLTSDTPDRQHACVTAVEAAKAAGNFGVLGVHIEGPFFEPNKRGAHKASMIRPPQPEDIDWLCSLELSSIIVTLAPEHTQPGQIRQLTEAGIRVCAGHTNASYAQIQNAISEGLCGFTHLFNAMSPLTSREPGVVGAALDNGDTWVGIIADGHHVHPACIRVAHSAKPEGKTLLVTDAMSTVGSTDSFFEMYGEKIEERDGRLINAEGVLAGSAIGMIDAVRVATDVAGIPLRESLRMAALYPAQFLRRQSELGRLKKGFRADLVHFDDHYSVLGTWVAGHHRAHNGESSLPTRRNPS